MASRASLRIERSRTYFARPKHYLAKSARIARRAELVRELLGNPSGRSILDLGCGSGAISAVFAARNEVTMVDASPAMIAAASHYRASHEVADLHCYTGPPADIVLCIGVLSHVDETEPVIASIARNLRAGGWCVLQLSDADQPINRINRAAYRLASSGRLRYRPTRLADTLDIAEGYGLRLMGQRQHFLIVPGLQRILGPLLGPYDRFICRTPLARLGSEHLLLLRKDQATSPYIVQER